MTKEQKLQIAKLRAGGYGYNRIAQALGVSVNTVKSFCRRNNLTSKATVDLPEVQVQVAEGMRFCKSCGIPIEQKLGRKEKSFVLISAEWSGGTTILIR